MAWERRRYRGNKVWIDVDPGGAPALDERGLASLRYKPEDDRTYSVRPDELLPLEESAAEPAAGAVTDDGAIHVYTDGASSGSPGPAGLGAVLLWRGRRKEIQRYLGRATSHEAELAAILAALEAIKRPGVPVRVHTDSEYAIGVLAGSRQAQAEVDLVRRLQAEMRRFEDLRFVNVPAHEGVPESERADRLAREALPPEARSPEPS